jgi:ABC-type polysaccharide/polyol phosphate export permease
MNEMTIPAVSQVDVRPNDSDLAVRDFVQGMLSFRIWSFLAWNEIKARYRRTIIGPFWITLNNAIMIFTMGPLYGALFHQDLKDYYLYLSTSIVVWGLIVSLVNESCMVFISAEGFIKQVKLPLSAYIFKNIYRNLIMFLHNFIVVVAVFFFYPPPLGIWLPFALVGILLVCLNAVWVGVVLGLICVRFRDVPQIVTSIMGVAFFLTPVMWQVKMLGVHGWIAELNPFFHFMEIIRGPLTRDEVSAVSFSVVIIITVIGNVSMFQLFKRFRSRVAYWL